MGWLHNRSFVLLVFFFSSRRRHTRYWRDWSSDVCSSDLDLHAAALADDALVADALVLAAVALPVLGGTEDALAEEAVLLGLERAVVDGLRLGDLAGRPGADLLRAREPDLDRIEVVDVDHACLLLVPRVLRVRRNWVVRHAEVALEHHLVGRVVLGL